MLSREITLFLFLNVISLVALDAHKVGIGTDNPNNSAMLDMVSANKGLLIPRVETSAVTSPATGLLAFQCGDACVSKLVQIQNAFRV